MNTPIVTEIHIERCRALLEFLEQQLQADAAEALRALVAAAKPTPETPLEAPQDWKQADGLLYTVRDGANWNEISVTQANGSRATAARTERATELLAMLSSHARVREATSRRPDAHLVSRCRELIELAEAGESPQEAIRALAATYDARIDDSERRKMAISQTYHDAMRAVLDAYDREGQPACVGEPYAPRFDEEAFQRLTANGEVAWADVEDPAQWVRDLRAGDESSCSGLPADAPERQAPMSLTCVWENFPGYLIDHCEGEVISEEFLQHALAAMLKNEQYAPRGTLTRDASAAARASLEDAAALDDPLSASEVETDAMRDAFEESAFYFNGESPVRRIEDWAVWRDAWKAARRSTRVEPIGYIDRREIPRLSNYKATIWPGVNEIDAVPVYLKPCSVPASSTGARFSPAQVNAGVAALYLGVHDGLDEQALVKAIAGDMRETEGTATPQARC
ncbi:hypothetical protein F6X40_09475 [Paraburkholderia sp. UCT31]|uniref:hypothetical protein n=1 Tax=Paraburkholderia sp. UCT31 TaxID=2615209 RepID=UPI0016565C52|nr:hypothetical protein [Paraburkholderia sp. UCT31]MBC8737038.1 hypothetical protein [Paraburkholderia sp. UCT31]